jgi:hypothetical protein
VKGCKQQSWKELQARHQQIRNRLSAAQVRIISPGGNRCDLGHVPQLFRHACVANGHSCLCDVWTAGIRGPRSAPLLRALGPRRPRLRRTCFSGTSGSENLGKIIGLRQRRRVCLLRLAAQLKLCPDTCLVNRNCARGREHPPFAQKPRKRMGTR